MRAQFLHLSGPRRGRTETFDGPLTVIGSAAEADLFLPDPAIAVRHAAVRWEEPNCAFRLIAGDGPVFVNRQQVREVILESGDEIEFGTGGPKARFSIYVPPGRVCKPVRRMLRDADAVKRSSGHLAGASTLVRDLLTQATPQLKVGFPVLVLLVALPLAWLAGWLGGRGSEQRRLTADAVTQQELERLRSELAAQQAAMAALVAQGQVLERIARDYGPGVCLIHGVFGYQKASGEWYEDSPGTRVELEYTGSGFLATRDGRVLTNRHVAAPWTEEPMTEVLERWGFRPEFVSLTATFPGRAPVAVDPATVRLRGDRIDVAVLRVATDEKVPVLPLHGDDLSDLTDRRAIVLGYPTGIGVLLARADEVLVADLKARRAGMREVIAALAGAGAIQPLLTEGVLGAREAQKLVYDAPTTHGGSGGPVFGGDGTVIGVNFAVLQGFGGANFGVPIRYARELLGP